MKTLKECTYLMQIYICYRHKAWHNPQSIYILTQDHVLVHVILFVRPIVHQHLNYNILNA